MKRIFLRLKQSLRNERGEITFFACFFVVGNVLWLQALLLFCFHLGNSFGFLKEASQNRCGYWQW